ncbi:MAG: tetratricopeptide repeat protein, partial [Candidatus Omnitrophica bacterium]|nr:tetratricopeptide repeat protein [Candidatus Omnitrophota bacterium]
MVFLRTIVLILIPSLHFPLWGQVADAAPPPRILRVGVAVTKDFKSVSDWKPKFERRLAYASKIFETEFGLRFVVSRYWDWSIPDGQQSTDHLLVDLMRRFPLKNVDLVIGLSRLTQEVFTPNKNDFDVLGRTQPFSGYLVLRYPETDLYKIQEETILVHELGHLFGAIHTGDPNTIMFPYVGKQIPSTFTKANRDIILLTRDMDFAKGINALDSETIERLLSSYLVFIQYDQPFEFYYALGHFYLRLGQDEEALRTFQAAEKLNQKLAKLYYDIGVVSWRLGKYEDARQALTKAISR